MALLKSATFFPTQYIIFFSPSIWFLAPQKTYFHPDESSPFSYILYQFWVSNPLENPNSQSLKNTKPSLSLKTINLHSSLKTLTLGRLPCSHPDLQLSLTCRDWNLIDSNDNKIRTEAGGDFGVIHHIVKQRGVVGQYNQICLGVFIFKILLWYLFWNNKKMWRFFFQDQLESNM